MLHKLFGIRTVKPPSGREVPPKPVASIRAPAEERSQALKIIHAGGRVESYYMAVPAARILEKQPSFVLARPDVFRRPWDSVVRPEEILTPGQKFFIVPRRTVKKLRRSIPRPTGEDSSVSFVSQHSTDTSAVIASQQKDLSSKSFLQETDVSFTSIVKSSKTKGKTKARNRHVRFFGVDSKHDSDSSFKKKKDSDSSFRKKNDSDSSFVEKRGNAKENQKKILNTWSGGRNKKLRNVVSWQPNLAVISESISSDE